MTDFLLELRSEEIPARMQGKARDDLARLFAAELDKAGLNAAAVTTYATPRRLALILTGLPERTAAVSEEIKGPRASAPPQALEGFLRKTGLAREALVERDGVLFAVIDKPGRAAAEVLAEAIPAVIRAFPWPKSMRWGAPSLSTESPRWVRPLQGIVALLGEAVVPVEVAGVASGAATVGHRFHHPGAITIGSAADYVEKLRACHVIVDPAERRNIIALGAKMAAQKAGLSLIEDAGLLDENAGLTEWPVPLLGRFDEAFLHVPPEVIQLTARVNQKYFVCRDGAGALANAFVCVANIDPVDGGAKIVAGNQKVLAARLSDARFFYETDLKVRLEDQLPKLGKIVFHEKLGTVADKVARVAKLARWLVEEGIVAGATFAPSATTPFVPSEVEGPAAGDALEGHASTALGTNGDGAVREQLADMAERAARLAKADLVTGMVGEFPELQGLMGGYYARAQGEPDAVADAVRDHYKPVGQGDEVPTAPVTVAVSLADKLDTLVTFFGAAMAPSGSKDPFALRRAALAVIRLVEGNGLRLSLNDATYAATFNFLVQTTYQDVPSQVVNDVSAAQNLGERPSTAQIERYTREVMDRPEFRQRNVEFHAEAQGLLDFFADRLKVQQREAGVRHDLIDAVFALGGEDDLVRLLARVHALQAFVATEDGANLLAGYKRAANILKKEGWETAAPAPVIPAKAGTQTRDADDGAETEAGPASRARENDELGYVPEAAEAALIAALDDAAPRARAAVAAEAFEAAMTALATLRAPIDAFFDQVTVNDSDPAKRAARLALLARVREAVHGVADFSKIEG